LHLGRELAVELFVLAGQQKIKSLFGPGFVTLPGNQEERRYEEETNRVTHQAIASSSY
jgi:hypothetical protein